MTTVFTLKVNATHIGYLEVARESESKWLSSALWDCLQHGGKFVPKKVPQCTLTTILTQSPVQPQLCIYKGTT